MAEKVESTFRLSYAVRTTIAASPAAIWEKLTDAAGFPSWNSTVESITGPIALGSKLKLRVPIAPGRTFSPTVVEFRVNEQMVWQDGFFPLFEGRRTFTLTPKGATTEFAMIEVFRGAMLPMIKRALPDFGPVFDRYVVDLKRATG